MYHLLYLRIRDIFEASKGWGLQVQTSRLTPKSCLWQCQAFFLKRLKCFQCENLLGLRRKKRRGWPGKAMVGGAFFAKIPSCGTISLLLRYN